MLTSCDILYLLRGLHVCNLTLEGLCSRLRPTSALSLVISLYYPEITQSTELFPKMSIYSLCMVVMPTDELLGYADAIRRSPVDINEPHKALL